MRKVFKMKNLNLNGLGVQEMNAEEMRETDGGKTLLGEAFDSAKAAAGIFFIILLVIMLL